MPKEAEKPEKRPIPAWMMSFSDMMTNMLCFFILMVALSTTQDAGLVETGIGSYLERLEALGLPGLLPSQRTLIPKDSPLARYKPPRIDPLNKENWVEHADRMLNEEFDRIEGGESDAESAGTPVPIPLGIRFSTGSERLTLKDRENLRELASSLRRRSGTVEILGACTPGEESGAAGRYDLSLKRAQAVSRYLEESGVPPDRLVAVGVGRASQQLSPEQTSETRRLVALRLRLP